jgi:4-hydroxy-2-oxoheptanedioate aldolase
MPSVQTVQVMARADAESVVRAVRYPPAGEHIDALKTIEEVVATPGLDLVFIGPGDLATSMGLKGRVEEPTVQAAIRKLESAILRSPVILGGVAHTTEQANAMIDRGYRALVVGFDWWLLQRGISFVISGIRGMN